MSKQTTTKITINMGAPMLLIFVIFLALKLTNMVSWPWIWVVSPIWLPLALIGGLFVIALIIAAIGLLIETIKR